MIIQTKRSAQVYYTLVLVIFWVIYGLMFAFAAKFLTDLGFSNSLIGLILGLSYTLSALLQPSIAAFLSRKKIGPQRWILTISGVNILLAIVVLVIATVQKGGVIGFPRAALVVVMVVMLSLQSSLDASINGMSKVLETAGTPVSFSMGRAFSGLVYAQMSWGMGFLLLKMSVRVIPLLYLIFLGLMVVLNLLWKIQGSGVIPEDTEKTKSQGGLKNPAFLILLPGIVCISFGHTFVDNFMLQIMEHVGGNSSHLGTALAIAAIAEFPAMLLYGTVSKKTGARALLIFSGWAWFVRNVLVLVSASPYTVYVAEAMQFFSYAVYIPSAIKVVGEMLPGQEFMKGVAFTGSSFTLGSVLATFIGGVLLDTVGVQSSLWVVVAMTMVGAILWTVAMSLKSGSQSKAQ